MEHVKDMLEVGLKSALAGALQEEAWEEAWEEEPSGGKGLEDVVSKLFSFAKQLKPDQLAELKKQYGVD